MTAMENGVQGMVTQEVKDFMNAVWDAEVIEGEKVIDKHLGFGAEPDIKFITKKLNGDTGWWITKKMMALM